MTNPQDRIDQHKQQMQALGAARERTVNQEIALSAKIRAFNEGGLNLNAADFLDPEAQRYIAGLVWSHVAAGHQPAFIGRGSTRGRFGIEHTEQALGWMLARNEYESAPGQGDQSTTEQHYMIITPQLALLSTPKLPEWQAIPSIFSVYREFDTRVIIESVVSQLAASNTPWVEPR